MLTLEAEASPRVFVSRQVLGDARPKGPGTTLSKNEDCPDEKDDPSSYGETQVTHTKEAHTMKAKVNRNKIAVAAGIAVLVLVVGGVTSACSSRTERSTATETTDSAQPFRVLPPLAPRLSRRRILFADDWAGSASKGEIEDYAMVYSIRLDGRGLRRIATGVFWFAASRDGTKIAYTPWLERVYPSKGGIHIVRADGKHIRWIDRASDKENAPPGPSDSQPAWSPDGHRLVFTSIGLTTRPGSGELFDVGIYVMNVDGSGRRFLANSAVDFPGPTWINNREILLSYKWGELAIISARTGRVVRLIRLPNKGTQPSADGPKLSPNGREIAVGVCDNSGCSAESVDVITLKGKLLRRIRSAHEPAWTPNGGLLYSSNTRQIMFAPAHGGPTRTITPPSFDAVQPAWIG